MSIYRTKWCCVDIQYVKHVIHVHNHDDIHQMMIIIFHYLLQKCGFRVLRLLDLSEEIVALA